MAFDARYLYKAATGSFPTTGQDLKTGLSAVSGDNAPDAWLVDSWTFGGTQPDENPVTPYSDGASFAMTMTISRGAKASAIQRTGAVIVITPSGPAGFDAVMTVNSILGTTGSVTVVVKAPYYNAGATLIAGQTWFRDYASPTEPPSGSGTQVVVFKTQISGASGSGQQDISFTLSYTPDNGPFNPNLVKSYVGVPFYNRAETREDFNVEWHTNSTYTNLHSSAPEFEINSDPLYAVSYWLRYRRIGDVSWVNLGEQAWLDPRLT